MTKYKKATAHSITQKINRKRNPVTSMVGLAREYGIRTDYNRYDGGKVSVAPPSFRRHVLKEVGEDVYNQITGNIVLR